MGAAARLPKKPGIQKLTPPSSALASFIALKLAMMHAPNSPAARPLNFKCSMTHPVLPDPLRRVHHDAGKAVRPIFCAEDAIFRGCIQFATRMVDDLPSLSQLPRSQLIHK